MPSITHRIYQLVTAQEDVLGGKRIALTFRANGDAVPAILLLPHAEQPSAAALLLHGWSSRKEHVADSIGHALLTHGIASLSIDLPAHGERTSPSSRGADPLALARQWRQALEDARLGLRFLAARREVDGARLALVGYSLGAYLGVTLAGGERSVRAVVLAAGGDLPADMPFGAAMRLIADPVRAVRALAGRPLLMVHGRHDRTILPEQAQRLFAAAAEPKEIRWWNAGHILPPAAIDDAVRWLAARLGGAPSTRDAATR